MTTPTSCLVVDASCDLPLHYLSLPELRLLPVKVVVGDTALVDKREPQVIDRFYRKHLVSVDAASGRSEPLSVEQMKAAIETQIAPKFDEALGLFVAASRSAIYERAKIAVKQARIASFPIRLQAGKTKPLQLDCVDSQALFAGYAVQAIDLIDHLQRGAGIMELLARQQHTVKHCYAYMAPGDVSYILKRASLKGEKSVSALAGFAAKALSIIPLIQAHQGQTQPVDKKLGRAKAQIALLLACQRMIEARLLISPHICLSYSGDLEDISKQLEFATLQGIAKLHQVNVHLAPMSITGSVNVGPNALVVGMLAHPHDPKFLLK